MRRSMRRSFPVMLTAAWLLAATAPAFAGQSGLSATEDDSTVSVTDGGRLVLSYRFGGVPFKPYVDQLFTRSTKTPGGIQILRDAPPDHLHHHGLMFAMVVDDVDFWAERPVSGKQLGGRPTISHADLPGGLARVSLAQQLRWTPPGQEKPLMTENRSVAVYSGDGLDATLVTWRSELEPGPDHDAVTLSGTHYDGLGMRFVESMDGVGRFLYACGEPGPIVRGTERVTPTKWAAYTAPVDGHPVTVALFDHPQNPRHPAGMFTMLQKFAYLSATPNVWKEPLELKAGRPLAFRYGVALWDGEVTAETIEALYQEWLEIDGVGSPSP